MRPVLLLWWCLLLLATAAGAAEDPGQAALRAQAPPWYDAGNDTWKRVDAQAPPAARSGPAIGAGIGGLFAWLMLVVVVGATLLLLWQLLKHVRIERTPLPEERRVAVARAVADLSALPFAEAGTQDAEAALAQARAARDWRRAVAWSYALHLVELDHAGVLHLARGTTNRGYLRALRQWMQADGRRGEVPPLLEEAIQGFERTWFGHQPADDAVVQQLEAGRERLRALLLATTGTRS